MMYLSKIQRQILRCLRDEPLNHFAVAADLVAAPFTIRGELKAMKRDRLVREYIATARGHVWELTPKGERLAWATDQVDMELGA